MKKKIALIGEGSVSDQVRSWASKSYLEQAGYDVKIILLPIAESKIDLPACDLALYSRPMAPEIMNFYKNVHTPVIVDQDDDFAAIPASHVAFKNIGRGNPKSLKRHHDALRIADHVIVSTNVIQDRLQDLGIPSDKFTVIPNGWDDHNKYWTESHRDPKHLTIGWGGTITHREDFELITNPVIKFLEKYENVCLTIAGDPTIYKKFWMISEERKLFVAMLPYKYYPYFLNTLDILLVPLVNDYFNRAKSDIKLVEAGATNLPWIASNVLQYTRWARGGFLCQTDEDWYNSLVMFRDEYTRKLYAEQGNDMAQLRKYSTIARQWVTTIERFL